MGPIKIVPVVFAAAALGCTPAMNKAGGNWAYDGHGGPENWGEIDPGFATCSEDVGWLVPKTPVKVAESDIAAFAKLYPMNARPTQPLHGRPIEATR